MSPALEAYYRIEAARELLSYALAGHLDPDLAVTAALQLLDLAHRFLTDDHPCVA